MALYLIGLGLDKKSVSLEALEAIQNCTTVYLEGYTVTFPYETKTLEETLTKKVTVLQRDEVEEEMILEEAKKTDVALLVYGDPLSATTHVHLLGSCKEQGIECFVYHNASVFTAVGESGLSLYKFGKTGSIPDWIEHTHKPMSFMDYVIQNQSIGAHTLLLSDIGLDFKRALGQLDLAAKESRFDLQKLVILSNTGTKQQWMFYGDVEDLQSKRIEEPFCIIVPGELSHTEKDFLEKLD